MIIKGKLVRFTDNIHSILTELEELPSGFETPYLPEPDHLVEQHPVMQQARIDQQLMYQEMANQNTAEATLYLEKISQDLVHLQKTAATNGHLTLAAYAALQLGNLYRETGDQLMAIESYEQSLAMAQQLNSSNLICQSMAGLHASMAIFCKFSRDRIPADEVRQMDERMAYLRKHIAPHLSHGRNEPVENHALHLEQGEMGVSNGVPIGTLNVKECVAIFVRIKGTHEIAALHLDMPADRKCIHQLFKILANGRTGLQYEARIVGGKWASSTDPNRARSRMRSEKNVADVALILGQKDDVELLSADIAHTEQPSSIVVDPHSFTLFEQSPPPPSINTTLSTARTLLRSAIYDVPLAFDSRISTEPFSVQLNNEEVGSLLDAYGSLSPLEIAGKLVSAMRDNPIESIKYSAAIIATLDEYHATTLDLANTVTEMLIKDGSCHQEGASPMREMILQGLISSQSAIRLGTGKKIGNQELIDTIYDTIKTSPPENAQTTLTRKLRRFEFSDEPHETHKKRVNTLYDKLSRTHAQ